ncbi:Ig-like domain-containing protein [Ructibacterium gallinarum]|uniref:Ig-like domain-containing protein n=1 Tax=Ructibacterium gallinarum TaxID=2779355 RepID=A0A9D5R9A9_9FIRM|nr:Ig-like domain-containing protein [Ructibacterium gallinarum]MBE5040885.1 Ig-like domain-containing protein [Ructibacterium gallinarum]
MDENMYGVATSEYFVNNHWGGTGEDYANGEVWETGWGSQGFFENAEDESGMIIQTSATCENPGNADIAISKIFTVNESLTGQEELNFTFEFNTFGIDDLENGAEIWFCYTNALGRLPMMKIGMNQSGYSVGFASSDSGLFMGIVPDNDTGVTIEKNKSYVLKLSMRPNKQGNSRLACVLESNGERKVAIVENWELAAIERMQSTGVVSIFVKQDMRAKTPVQLLNLKRVKIDGYREDVKLNTTFVPNDGAKDIRVDQTFSAEFESAVNEIMPEQISVTGEGFNGSVENLKMENDGKKVAFNIAGLKSNSTYTITLSNVYEQGTETAFDYTWSFTTGDSIAFGRARLKNGGDLTLGQNTVVVPYTNSENTAFDVCAVVAVCQGANNRYKIVDAFIEEFTQIDGLNGNLEFDVTLDSNTDRFIKIFMLKDKQTLIPMATEQLLYTAN